MRWALGLGAFVVVAVAAAAGGWAVGSHRSSRTGPFVMRSVVDAPNPSGGRLRISAGAVEGTRFGAVLVAPTGERWVAPSLLTTPTSGGALHLVDAPGPRATGGSYVFESDSDWFYAIDCEDFECPSQLYTLGPRLDPAHLPRLTERGIAATVTYGHDRTTSVVLVGIDNSGVDHVFGFLEGFSLPSPPASSGLLQRPLVAPDHRLYRIDVAGRHLIRVRGMSSMAGRGRSTDRQRCTTWPAAPGHYRACPGSITWVSPRGSKTPIYVDQPCDTTCRTASNWGPVLLSPDRRTLLAAERGPGCADYFTSYLIPAAGGDRVALRTPDGVFETRPLGWLGVGSALVVEEGTGDCGDGPLGVGSVDPRGDVTEVLATNGGDATAWGVQP